MYNQYKIQAIRILPSDKVTFPTEKEFKHFIQHTMINRDGDYYFPNTMMKCPPNTLVLFQYDGMVRASGIMIESAKKSMIDERGIEYAGYYKFDIGTLKYLDRPIDKEKLKEIYPNFKGFNQTKQIIPNEYLNNIISVINGDEKINKDFLFEKIVDKSALYEGISIPASVQEKLYNGIGSKLKFGESTEIDIIINDNVYKAQLKNQTYDKGKYKNRADIVQIRYSKETEIAKVLRQKFISSTLIIEKLKNDNKKIYIQKEQHEKIRIYNTDKINTLYFECIPLQYEHEEKIAKILDDADLTNIAKKRSKIIREVAERKVTVRYRDSYISEYAKRRAKGVCQLCGEKAPFLNREGEPYLETHHIIWLSEGGQDSIDNVVALCPNCHRKMHVINDKEDVEYLKCKVLNL